jgi:hypothetical protein
VLSPAELARTAAYVYTLSHPGTTLEDTSHATTAPESTRRADTVPPL